MKPGHDCVTRAEIGCGNAVLKIYTHKLGIGNPAHQLCGSENKSIHSLIVISQENVLRLRWADEQITQFSPIESLMELARPRPVTTMPVGVPA